MQALLAGFRDMSSDSTGAHDGTLFASKRLEGNSSKQGAQERHSFSMHPLDIPFSFADSCGQIGMLRIAQRRMM